MQNQALAQKPVVAEDTPMLDISRLDQTPLAQSPYEYVIVRDFIKKEWEERMLAGYPRLKEGGSFPLSTVEHGEDFQRLIDELNGDAFRKAVEKKFSLDLSGRPTMFTVRGRCRQKDGQTHTDSRSKIITVLLYMNPSWQEQGGRLRLLRSSDVNDVAVEVPPDIGTLLIFRRSDNSWHGHLPFDGERRVIQMNWVTDEEYAGRERWRHKLSSFIKRLMSGGKAPEAGY